MSQEDKHRDRLQQILTQLSDDIAWRAIYRLMDELGANALEFDAIARQPSDSDDAVMLVVRISKSSDREDGLNETL